MGENKRYYWLKLKENFFTEKEIKKLRKVAGGDTFTIIYLKLLLLSIKNEGKLIFDSVEDTFVEEMALEIDEDVENVKVTIMFLTKFRLIEEVTNEEFILTETFNNIGSETQVASRVRKHREEQKVLQCNALVTKCNTEREKEIEKEKDIEIDKERESINKNSLTLSLYTEKITNGKWFIAKDIDKLNVLIEMYTYDWVKDAVDNAALKKKYSIAYTEAILKNWTVEGKEDTYSKGLINKKENNDGESIGDSRLYTTQKF